MQLQDVTRMRRLAALEMVGFAAGIAGLTMGSVPLMLLSSGIIASHLARRESQASFFDFHAPSTILVVVAVTLLGWPWWNGICLALVLFSALNQPLNVAIWITSADEVARRLRPH